MSGQYPPLEYRQVVHGLKKLGFSPRPRKSTSHEQWVKETAGGFWKVTVDEPKSPFGPDLVRSMAAQAGVSKKEFYKACLGR